MTKIYYFVMPVQSYLTKVKSAARDQNKCVGAVLMSLPKVFDCSTDDQLHAKKLEACRLFSEAVKLSESYTSNSLQRIKIGVIISELDKIMCVPQGSADSGHLFLSVFIKTFLLFKQHQYYFVQLCW